MSRILTRGLTAVALTGLATFGLTGVAQAATLCGYANQPACLPATASTTSPKPGEKVGGTAGPYDTPQTIPAILAPAGTTSTAPRISLSGPTADGQQTLAIGRSAAPAPVTLGTFGTNAAGMINYTVTIPENTTPGRYTLNFPGTLPGGAEVTYFVSLNIQGDGAGGGLPLTGTEIGTAAAAAAALLAVGTVVVVAARRRRETATA